MGVAAEYSSNPFLAPSAAHSDDDVALLLNAPVSYDRDWEHFMVTPAIRYSSSGNYSSLSSNYFHLNGNANFDTDLDTVTLTSGIGRDSSLYQSGLKSDGLGVRTDGITAGADWQRALTPRETFDLNAGWQRSLYNEAANTSGLVDYRYFSEGSSGTYAINERTDLQLILGAGQYAALDGDSSSKNYSLQLGSIRQLTELWTLTTNFGYTRSENSQKLFEGPFFFEGVEYGPYYIGTFKSKQQGPVYSASLTRQAEKVNVTASASRAYRPSGFNFLSRTDVIELDVSWMRSERWTFATKLNYQNTATPTPDGGFNSVKYLNSQLSAGFHWTPNWLVSLQATYVRVSYQLPPVRADSSSVSLQISRQFLRIDL